MKTLPGLVVLAVCCSVPAFARQDVSAGVAAARKQIEAGNITAGAGALEKIVAGAPRSFEARLALGRALDLLGRHQPARRHLEEALSLARDDERNSALTALGISYAFESKADEAARYYQRAFDAEMQADDRGGAAGLAKALGRIYLESGNLDKAEEWYTTGYETSKKIQGITPGDAALWEMRRHNAFGRIAARRGNTAAAAGHVAAVKALLDKGSNENQRAFYPYLVGYIAFFARDYRQAIAELAKGDQGDPFILGLIAQSHEKLREREAAAEYYRKVMAVPSHNINAAFSRPLARKFLR
jgi:tetratricopeptide (TPR) repeat protein